MSKFMRAALKNEPITIYGDGSQTRTFCFIDDNTDFCVDAIKNTASINQVYNVGNDVIITILELAEIIIKKTNSSSEIIHLPPLKDGDMTRRQPDISKMKTLLNRDLTTLENGIDYLIDSKRFN
jgi:nucleoside-diphosphate-sugar epimerase